MIELENTIPNTVNLTIKPETATNEAKQAGLKLLELIDNKKHKIIIKGKRYIEFEDWVALGNFYGITVRTCEPEYIEIGENRGFQAKAEVLNVNNGLIIGGATSHCLDDEPQWKNKPYFQMASMAQTSAASKALSNLLRWVVALSGLAGTPAEEMTQKRRTKHTNQKNTTQKNNTPKNWIEEELEREASRIASEINSKTETKTETPPVEVIQMIK